MMLKAFKYAFEEDLEVVLQNFLLALEEVKDEEPMDILIYYGEIYLKYIELTNNDIEEEYIEEQIKKLNGKGAVTMSILQKRERLGIEKGIEKGRQEEKIKIAKNLLNEGVEIALVAKSTGLSKTEVEKLKEEFKK